MTDTLRHTEVDEIILSTLPSGISRWLRLDVPHRLQNAVHCPVIVVKEVPETAPAG